MTPEERKEYNARQNERNKKRIQNMTPEEKKEYNTRAYENRRAHETTEQRANKLAAQRKENMTPEK